MQRWIIGIGSAFIIILAVALAEQRSSRAASPAFETTSGTFQAVCAEGYYAGQIYQPPACFILNTVSGQVENIFHPGRILND